MSVPITLEHQHRLPPHHRVLPLLAVGAARLLTTLRPHRLRRVLELARRGARPATDQQALTARQAVVAVSLRTLLTIPPTPRPPSRRRLRRNP